MEIKNAVQAIMDRRSIRKYKPEQLTDEQLGIILDAYDWAPTARNAQEVRAIVIRSAQLLSAFAADFEAYAAATGGKLFKNFYFGAPVLILLCGDKEFPYTPIDSGIAAASMAIAADSIGLGSVILGCIRQYMADEASAGWREKFGIRDDEMFTIALAVGTPDCEIPKGAARREGKISYID